MTDEEFNVLDELYFVIPFSELRNLTEYEDEILIKTLMSLKEKGWIKFLKDVDMEWDEINLTNDQIQQTLFLATKSGLLAHNS